MAEIELLEPKTLRLTPDFDAQNVAINTQHSIINNTGYNLFMLVKMRAGSGDVNSGEVYGYWGESGETGWHYYLSLEGKRGNYINLTHKASTYSAIGGKGGMAGVQKRQSMYYWHRDRDGSGNVTNQYWAHNYERYLNNHKIAREGQIKMFPLLFKNNEVLEVAFTCYGAKNYDGITIFQGEVILTPL